MAKRKGETSYKETALGIIPRSKLILLEIEGIKRAWDFVIQKSEKRKLPLTPDFIKEIHKLGFGWIFPEMCGRYRTIDVTVSKHTPPNFYLIPPLMLEFSEDLKIRLKFLPKIEEEIFLDELISLLAWSHSRFLWIHPFQDYNGRIGRLLINIILLNLNLPPIKLNVDTKVNRQKYIDALQLADNHDYSLLENIIRKAITRAITDLKNKK